MPRRTHVRESGHERAALRDLFHTREFVALFVADVQSIIGDQIARVALSVLVYHATGSAPTTALVYAATFVPAILGGLLLAGIGDRLPRVGVLVACALARAALFGAMVWPCSGIASIIVLLVAAVLIGPVFGATEVAYLSTALPDRLFGSSTGLRLTSNQLAQVSGFAIGGIVVAAVGTRGALLVNAGTFVVAAAVIGVFIRSRPSPEQRPTQPAIALRSVVGWFRADRVMLALLALSALDGLFVVPEGLAVPFGQDSGADTTGVGLLFAAMPLGGAIGAGLLVRFVPDGRRPRLACWMAAGCGLPLTVCALTPSWPVAFASWAVTGALSAFQVVAITSVARAAPSASRARIVGFGGAVVVAAQGAGLIGFGALARIVAPGTSIAIAGAVGTALACSLVLSPLAAWRRGGDRRSHAPALSSDPAGAPRPN